MSARVPVGSRAAAGPEPLTPKKPARPGRPGSGKITIKDLAQLANVSPATISLALNRSPKIARDTRERILRLSEQAGYVRNQQAASLRQQQSRTAAICLNTVDNPVFSSIVRATERFLWSRGWAVMFGETEDSVEKQSAFIARLIEHNVAGLVVIPATGTRAGDLERFAHHIPIVLASRALEGSVLDQVNIEYKSGVSAAVEHLVAQGHREIGWIGGGLDTSTSHRGFQAYRAALKRAGIEYRAAFSCRCIPSRQNGLRAMRQLRERAPDLTAVLCFSDLLASGALAALRTLGLTPGRDISIVGFDDLEEASYMAPPLTTVRIDLALLGEAAARLLVNRIAEPLLPRQDASIAVQLVVRESTGSPQRGPNPTKIER